VQATRNMQADKAKQMEYNLAILKRRDANITEVLNSSAHVVLYQFNEAKQSWDLKKVEGSMFVVARATEPRHMFVVLNRLSNDNVVEGITADFQMELTDQFLLYRNVRQEIIGIWFYSTSERAEIAKLLESLIVSDETPDAPTASAAPPGSESGGGVETQGAPVDAATSLAVHDGTPAQAPAEAATASNVAEFFSMMQSQLPAAAVPPMPTGATDASAALILPARNDDAAGSGTHPPVLVSECAQASSASSEAMQTGQAVHQPAVPTVESQEGQSSTSSTTGDVRQLKSELRAQLLRLLDDDSFMELLASEYLQLRGASSSSSQQHRTGELPSAAASTQESAATSGVPAHLMALLQQQMSDASMGPTMPSSAM